MSRTGQSLAEVSSQVQLMQQVDVLAILGSIANSSPGSAKKNHHSAILSTRILIALEL